MASEQFLSSNRGRSVGRSFIRSLAVTCMLALGTESALAETWTLHLDDGRRVEAFVAEACERGFVSGRVDGHRLVVKTAAIDRIDVDRGTHLPLGLGIGWCAGLLATLLPTRTRSGIVRRTGWKILDHASARQVLHPAMLTTAGLLIGGTAGLLSSRTDVIDLNGIREGHRDRVIAMHAAAAVRNNIHQQPVGEPR